MGSRDRLIKRGIIGLLLGLVLVFGWSSVFAQSSLRFAVEWIDTSLYPTVQVYLGVSDMLGFPLSGLDKKDFTLTVAGQEVTDFEVAPFHNTDQPLAFVLAIDTSGSMEAVSYSQTALDQAVEAAKVFLGKLSPDDRVALIAFADEVEVIQELTSDKSAVETALDSLEPGGGTKLYDAVYQGIEILENVPERKVVIFLTDGKESGSSEQTAESVAQKAAGSGVPVYPIGFGDVNRDNLIAIASESGGYAQIKPDAAALQTAFTTVLDLLHAQTLLRFTSELPADNTEQEVTVTLTHQGNEFSDSGVFTTQPYTTAIESPEEGVQFSEPILVEASVTPEIRTASVEFYLDDVSFAVVTNPPYQAQVPVDDSSYGEKELKAVATDVNGITAENQILVTTRPPIIINFVSVSEGDILRGAPVIQVEVDALNDLESVAIFVDSDELKSFSEGPFEVEWPLYNVESGKYVLAATADDVEGNTDREEILVYINQADVQPGSGQVTPIASEPNGEPVIGGNGGLLPDSGISIWIIVAAIAVLAAVIVFISIKRRKGGGKGKNVIGQPILLEIAGRSPGTKWTLGGGELRLGRQASDNDIPLEGKGASRQMAVIRSSEQGYIVFSLVPNNPVLINGAPVAQQQVLQPGDVVLLGDSEFHYLAEDA